MSKFQRPPAACLLVFLLLIPGLVVSVTGAINILNTNFSDETLAKASSILSPNEIRTLVGYTDLSDARNLSALIVYVYLGANLYTYTAIVYFSVRIWSAMRALSAQACASVRTRELNRELNWVLAVQALVPLVFYLLPSTIVMLGDAVGVVPMGAGTQIFMVTVPNLQPVANGLLTLLLVKPYRRSVMEIVNVCGHKSYSQTTHTVAVTAITLHS